MATVSAAAVQQDRIYVTSGFVEDGYIRDDRQPTSTSIIAGKLALVDRGGFLSSAITSAEVYGGLINQGGFLSVAVASSEVYGGLISKNAFLSKALASAEVRGRLKWNLEDFAPTEWGDDAPASISWSEADNTEESPFG